MKLTVTLIRYCYCGSKLSESVDETLVSVIKAIEKCFFVVK